VLLYPTDTVWGLGCDATNPNAVAAVYAIKQRADTQSMLVLLHHINQLGKYVHQIPPMAADLIELATKPLTIIYPGAQNLAPNLVAADQTIGIRITTDEFCSALLQKFNKPMVSTSANISGRPTPGNFSQIDAGVIQKANYVVTWRQTERKQATPSGIIKLDVNGEVRVIRE
jgi:L-threonylcarbamoyladenylate synthase